MVTRVAFGVRVLNGGDHLEEALASILAQSYRDFGVVVMDNCSTDATPQIGRRFAAADPRVRYRRNTETVGMVDNWRRAFDAAREEFGDFEYFAFGSDHDIWEPEWLESLIGELDGDETAVLAYPLTKPIRPDGTPFDDPMTRRQWDSTALAGPRRARQAGRSRQRAPRQHDARALPRRRAGAVRRGAGDTRRRPGLDAAARGSRDVQADPS